MAVAVKEMKATIDLDLFDVNMLGHVIAVRHEFCGVESVMKFGQYCPDLSHVTGRLLELLLEIIALLVLLYLSHTFVTTIDTMESLTLTITQYPSLVIRVPSV